MRTIQEKYNAILEGNFSKSQFVKDAKRELSQFISPFNGYKDTVSILKSKGVIFEAAKKEVPHYDKPEPGYSIETIERGVDYELEGMGLMSQETVSEEDYAKAKQKAEKNLKKDPNHYLHLLAGESKKVDKHDQMVPVKKNNHVDTINGLKKAELREAIDYTLDPYEDRDKILKQVMSLLVREKGASREELKGFISTHMEDILNAPDEAAIVDEFEQYISVNNDYVDEKKGKDHDGDGDIDSDDYLAAKDKAIKGVKEVGMFHDPRMSSGNFDHLTPSKEEENSFKEGDKVTVTMRGTKADGPEEATILAMDPSGVAIVKNAEGREDEVYTKDMQPVQEINEGRRRKMKGGKVVTENDYETGGYVESMGPRLDKALKALTIVWDEWKNGPATEPGMVPFAKKDLVSYIDSKILEGEDIAEENIEEYQDIKEAFKAIISKVLQEEVINEAATGNLSKVATSYDDFEGMQTAVNSLENIVTEVESFYAKTKEKIQKVYDSFKDIKNVEGLAVGAMLAPAIESAFKKDLIPVTEKGFTRGLEMPKVKMLETDGIAEEELDEKETVFTPINEALNKELIKFGPDLMKRLKTAGFETGLFKGQGMVPVEAQKKIKANPKLAGIAYKRYPDGYEFLEVSVQREKGEELEKVAKYFSTPEGQYGPDKDAGWVVKNIRNVNTGDIYRSNIGGMNGLATITYFRAEEADSGRYGTDKVKTTDKIAAEGKKYKYSKRK